MSYYVVFQKDERDVGTLYWNGSLAETHRLARQITIKGLADSFRISELTEGGSEKRPFQDQGNKTSTRDPK